MTELEQLEKEYKSAVGRFEYWDSLEPTAPGRNYFRTQYKQRVQKIGKQIRELKKKNERN